MKLEKFLALYPEAEVALSPTDSADKISLPLADGRFVVFLRGELGEKELALIAATLEEADVTKEEAPDAWYEFLLGSGPLPDESVQAGAIVQFAAKNLSDDFIRHNYLCALANLFPKVIASNWQSNSSGYLVVDRQPNPSEIEKLKAQVTVLDSDFYTRMRLFLGTSQDFSAYDKRLFEFERALFGKSTKQVGDFATEILPFLRAPHLAVFQLLKKQLFETPEEVEMVAALYSSQGHVKRAADALFVHKNTLVYRMNKFTKATGVNLKDAASLTACYLVATSD